MADARTQAARRLSNMMRGGRANGGRRLQGGPVFPGMPKPGAPQGGYQGLDQVMQMLQGGVNQGQFDKLAQGYTGANGAIGGMHGAMSGLSPQAVHFLATSGLLAKQDPAHVATTDAAGNPLTGDALFNANLQNTLSAQAPAQYKLHSGVDQSQLANYLSQVQGGGFAKGFDANGPVGGQGAGGFLPPRTVFPGGGPVNHPGGGLPGGLLGHGPRFTGMGNNGFGRGFHGHPPNRVQGIPHGIKGWH